MDEKLSLKGAWVRHMTHLNFWGSIYISGMAEAGVVKFCIQRDYIKIHITKSTAGDPLLHVQLCI